MLKKLVLCLAFTLMPAAAMAQHQHGGHDAAKPKDNGHAAMMKQHEAFVEHVIEERAELKLTDEQVVKLRKFAAKMVEHHKMEMAHAAAGHHDAATEGKMHKEFDSIFTEAQLAKVNEMRAEHAKSCMPSGEKQCKMPPASKM